MPTNSSYPQSEYQQLLLKIARCSETAKVNATHPCNKIVQLQTGAQRQLPEPWSGQLDLAPILFLSSNPSINEQEVYPTSNCNDNQIIEFFHHRFAAPNGPSTGLKALLKDDTRTRVISFWASARARTSEILNKSKHDIIPGRDFALTEVVHCKSRNEIGVKEAVSLCTQNYLEQILSLANANIFIVTGDFAKDAIRTNYPNLSANPAEFMLNGRKKIVAFLPHPNRPGPPKSLLDNIDTSGIQQLQSYLPR